MPDVFAPLTAPTSGGQDQTPPEFIVDNPIGVDKKPPSRHEQLILDKDKLVSEVVENYRNDLINRDEWSKARIQRTAKYRGWREKKTYPWDDACNSHLPVIMTDVQRTEDTLHNAVLSTRPVMNAKALGKDWSDSEKALDDLLDYQMFGENMGEERIGSLISSFTQDGQFIAYVPYIREKQKVVRKYTIPYPPPGVSWEEHLHTALRGYYPKSVILPGTNPPWEWVVREQHPLTGKVIEFKAKVLTDSDINVQILCKHDETIFDGPALIPIELENIVVPNRSENLQPVCMSNPKGAPRLAMVDYPTRDEIKRLYREKFYDALTEEDLKTLEQSPSDVKANETEDPQAQKRLKDELTGVHVGKAEPDIYKTLTRLTVFMQYDLDGDGLLEEAVFWLILEPKMLLRARYLTEVYPISPPRRPFSMAKYIPVNEQFYAIGLIELMESGYDLIKRVFDQMIDSGELSNTPFGFYRPMSGIKPEVMRLGPGDLAPTNTPREDVYFPQLPQGMQAFGHNIISLVSQILDQTTLVGQLQLGSIPAGRSAALRTTSNMQALLQQGDARPERVLRRFFKGLAEIWQQFFELDQIHLPPGKKFRVMHGASKETNPFRELDDPSVLKGRFTFDFSASILNTNKALATTARQQLIGVLITPLMYQLGISNPQTIYQLLYDYIRDFGQEPLKYIAVPPGANPVGPMISAEEAILAIMNGRFPIGAALEPLDQHVAKLHEFVATERLNLFSPGQAALFGQYAAQKVAELQQMIEQAQIMQAMQEFQSQGNGGQPGPKGTSTPPNSGPGGNPPVQGNELLDESLPSARGAR
ncbi:MAG: hypothetical protein MN733_16350 [Nitrososphaera sp.]|nr:hypothetical protein [Nitrososphaera sp.]